MGKSPKSPIQVDEEIILIPYYPNYGAALTWYQDPALCRQLGNRDGALTLAQLKRRYHAQLTAGRLYYVKYHHRLCGDVSLSAAGELSVVLAPSCQNRHVGRRIVPVLLDMAKDMGLERCFADICETNVQAQRMFAAAGFQRGRDGRCEILL